jgi:nitronate monooxygenase
MKLPTLKIGNLIARIPIIQGGMGIGVSLSGLASAVANEGGIGVISAAQIGFREEDFEKDILSANLRAIKKEIIKAREKSPKGIIGMNIMVAANNYTELVMTAVKEKIDLIICGAGIPKDLPKFVKGTNTKAVPIVSSAKAATIISKLWTKKYDYLPDAIIVEGPKAGGHLGFSMDTLKDVSKPSLMEITKEVIDAVKPFENQYNKKIPVIAAGGIFSGKDMAEFINMGASGVQMATRFVATEECDAHINYKRAYINSKEEDIQLIKSPVGMPGRAIKNEFIHDVEEQKTPIKKCFKCLKHCDPKTAPYCITKALINAVNGDVENGLIFAGTNAHKLDKIITVKELMSTLVKEAEAYKS